MSLNALEVALGNGLEWSIQSWVNTTGRKVRIAEAPWLGRTHRRETHRRRVL
jgi:hypothetical protein